MKKYIQPQLVIENVEDDMLVASNKKKPGWGPNKDSDEDGHDAPPGHKKSVFDEEINDEIFEVL